MTLADAVLCRGLAISFAIPIILLIRLLMRRAPARLRAFLWLPVWLRLLVPIFVHIPMPAVPTSSPFYPMRESSRYLAMTNVFEQVRTTDIVSMFIWLAGVMALLTYALVSALRLKKKLRTAVRIDDDAVMADIPGAPFVFGLRHPVIYLPFGLPEETAQQVLLHERAHIRRRDYLIKPAVFLLTSLFWVDPLLWVAYGMLCRDLEMACDETALHGANTATRADYAQALLDCTNGKRTGPCPVAFGESGVAGRIRTVLRARPVRRSACAVGAVLLAASVFFLYVQPVGGSVRGAAFGPLTSSMFTEEELTQARSAVLSSFPRSFDGGRLVRLDYGGDASATCTEETEQVVFFAEIYAEYLIDDIPLPNPPRQLFIDSRMWTLDTGDDRTFTRYPYIVARQSDGSWKVVKSGYCALLD